MFILAHTSEMQFITVKSVWGGRSLHLQAGRWERPMLVLNFLSCFHSARESAQGMVLSTESRSSYLNLSNLSQAIPGVFVSQLILDSVNLALELTITYTHTLMRKMWDAQTHSKDNHKVESMYFKHKYIVIYLYNDLYPDSPNECYEIMQKWIAYCHKVR